MPLPYDSAFTLLWVAAACAMFALVRRWSNILEIFLLSVAVFPIPENMIRSSMRVGYIAHPENLWKLSATAIAMRVVACTIAAFRSVRCCTRMRR